MRKIIHILSIAILLGSVHVYASGLTHKPFFLAPTTLGFDHTLGLFLSNAMPVNMKNGNVETKQPATRRGTENWEEPQTSFFIVPAVSIGIIALFLIFNRNKD